MRGLLTTDQADLLIACAAVEDELSIDTSMERGTVVRHEQLPHGFVEAAVTDIWDLADGGLFAVVYEATQHAGSFRVTRKGLRVAAELERGR
jgi:hypothetical protein